MLLGFISGLSTEASLLLILCIVAVCAFEAINGFHDTANAVATVIYTKTLPPVFAVVWAGTWNFIGVLLGGVTVAMGIIKLMPLMDMIDTPLGENIALVLAILVTAISWNLGTWYFGIPCSSSHTLIGSLLGGGFAFWASHGWQYQKGPDWNKAIETGKFLLISPLFGFALAILLMFVMKSAFKKRKVIFKSPDETKKVPPTWIRVILISTCTLVSYFHGNNDGQKGVGLVLVIMIAFLPMQFAFNPAVNLSDLSASARRIEASLQQEGGTVAPGLSLQASHLATQIDTTDLRDKKEMFAVRKSIQGLNKQLDAAIKSGIFATKESKTVVKHEIKSLAKTYEYAPFWVIVLISLCLGAGTMVGWKRIVVTIGEKIGKTHLTYAQGATAELCAAATIGMSSGFGQPVSTTHVLSSAIAGTMVAEGGVTNLRRKTIMTIALAWVLTLPVTFVGAMLLFFLFRMFTHQ